MNKFLVFLLLAFTVCMIDAKITDRISKIKKPVIESPIYTVDEDGNLVPYKLIPMQQEVMRQLGQNQLYLKGNGITLNEPGSYILANNVISLTAPITIAGSNINLDLNGFHVSNPSGVGINIAGGGGIKNVCVFNGTVRDCGGNGIAVDNVQNLVFDSLLSTDNTSTGHGFDFGQSCTNCLITNCRADNNAGRGFNMGTDVGGGTLFEFRQCIATENVSDGFGVHGTNYLFESCASSRNLVAGFKIGPTVPVSQVVLRDCQVLNNINHGIHSLAVGGSNITIEHCEMIGNGDQGLLANTWLNCLIKDCTVIGNGSQGIRIAGTSSICSVENNTLIDNFNQGLFLDGSGLIILDNEMIGNRSGGGMRIVGNENLVRGNVSINNKGGTGIGLLLAGANNIAEKNTTENNDSLGLVLEGIGNIAKENLSRGNSQIGISLPNGSTTNLVIKNISTFNNFGQYNIGGSPGAAMIRTIVVATTTAIDGWQNLTI